MTVFLIKTFSKTAHMRAHMHACTHPGPYNFCVVMLVDKSLNKPKLNGIYINGKWDVTETSIR